VITMPKAKPTQVIVHRVELQEKEREMCEAYIGSQVVKNVVQPVAIAGGIGVAGYLGYKSLKSIHNWSEDIIEDIKRTPANAGVQVAKLTPAGRVATNLQRLANWAFSPVESTQ
jgi:hypothetical protein